MNMQELVDKAKADYPIGVRIISPSSGVEFEITGDKFTAYGERIEGIGSKLMLNGNLASGYNPHVYYHGRWAEVISSQNYPIF